MGKQPTTKPLSKKAFRRKVPSSKKNCKRQAARKTGRVIKLRKTLHYPTYSVIPYKTVLQDPTLQSKWNAICSYKLVEGDGSEEMMVMNKSGSKSSTESKVTFEENGKRGLKPVSIPMGGWLGAVVYRMDGEFNYDVDYICAAKGHGKQLWQHFVSTIMKPGKTVRVELMADGVDAFKFWKKLGFLSETKNLDANSTTFVEMSLDLVG